ncbi:complement C1q-like protein 2 [Crassostrea virginica]
MQYILFFVAIHGLSLTVLSSSHDDLMSLKNNVLKLEHDLARQRAINGEIRKGLYQIRKSRAANCSASPIVFQARLSSTIYPLGANQIIAYDSIVTNEGNAYDTLTGMFEATVTGLYQFMATMWSNDGYNVDFQMIYNGAEVCAGRTTTTNQSMGICSAILQIPTGGRVFVRHKGTSGNYALGGNYAVFAGHLIM